MQCWYACGRTHWVSDWTISEVVEMTCLFTALQRLFLILMLTTWQLADLSYQKASDMLCACCLALVQLLTACLPIRSAADSFCTLCLHNMPTTASKRLRQRLTSTPFQVPLTTVIADPVIWLLCFVYSGPNDFLCRRVWPLLVQMLQHPSEATRRKAAVSIIDMTYTASSEFTALLLSEKADMLDLLLKLLASTDSVENCSYYANLLESSRFTVTRLASSAFKMQEPYLLC